MAWVTPLVADGHLDRKEDDRYPGGKEYCTANCGNQPALQQHSATYANLAHARLTSLHYGNASLPNSDQ